MNTRNPLAHGPPEEYFFFECGTCGEYPVSQETARKFLTKKLRRTLDEALQNGAAGAVLRFKCGCPKCKPDNPNARVKLSALEPKKH